MSSNNMYNIIYILLKKPTITPTVYHLWEAYQLRFRLSHRPYDGELCDLVPLGLGELGEGNELHVEALAPTQRPLGAL